MATEYGNIDDFLQSGKSAVHPATPEHQPEVTENDYDDTPSYDTEPEPVKGIELDSHDDYQQEHEDEPEPETKAVEKEVDEYGNEKAPPRTYTQEEVNEMFRKRFKNHNPQQTNEQIQQQVQQASDAGFEYNEDSNVPWQQQLEQFVEHTVKKISQKEQQQQVQQREQNAEMEFKDKFTSGAERFQDFREVVETQPMTNFMTMALRGMKDPSAFIYAASKRAPAELQRISQIGDPYAQIVEMGKLEERMRKSPTQSKAPRPVARTRDDGKLTIENKKKEDSIEDMIARSDAKRRAQQAAKRGR
jgi:hypothetical protein